MNVVVIGLGSMGNRRIRLIRKLEKDITIVGVDSNIDRRTDAKEKHHINTFSTLDEAAESIPLDSAFICTSPLSHNALISICLDHDLNVFTEINLVDDGYNENIKKASNRGKKLFLSSTFLYRDEIKYISRRVKESSSTLNYIYHVGQYLPDWHPWEDYSNYFVGDKRTNGCREIFAIDLPWIISTFGAVKDIQTIKSKNTMLKIDYNDNYIVVISHQNGTKGVIAVDVVSRKAVRNLEIYGEDLYISWDGSPTGLYEYDYCNRVNSKINLYQKIDQQEGYSAFIIENAYQNEIVSFFDHIVNDTKSIYDFYMDKATLALIDQIEAQSEKL